MYFSSFLFAIGLLERDKAGMPYHDEEKKKFYLNNVKIINNEKNYVEGFVRSFSNPTHFHKVVVSKYGAVCDCLGMLNLKTKNICVHAEIILEKLKTKNDFLLMNEREEKTTYYLKTNTFFDEFGGLVRGETTLLYGPDGSGKSQALLTLTAKLSLNKKVLLILTEGTSLYAQRRIQQMNGNLKNVLIREFKEEAKFHVYMGGDIHSSLDYYFLEERIGGKDLAEKRKTMTANAKSWPRLEEEKLEEIEAVVVDSITRYYSIHTNIMKPQDRLRVAAVFGGNVNIYDNYVHRIFENPAAMVWSAWLKSGHGDLLDRNKQIQKAEKDVEQMIHLQDKKEWLGPEALGHVCKVIYKILPEGAGIFSLTQIRGEFMNKKIVCKITTEGVTKYENI